MNRVCILQTACVRFGFTLLKSYLPNRHGNVKYVNFAMPFSSYISFSWYKFCRQLPIINLIFITNAKITNSRNGKILLQNTLTP